MLYQDLQNITMDDLQVAFSNPENFRFSLETLSYIHKSGAACVLSDKVKDPLKVKAVLQNSFPGLSDQEADYHIRLSQEYVKAKEKAGKPNRSY